MKIMGANNKLFGSAVLLAAFAILVSACGGMSSNPTEKYDKLRADAKRKDQVGALEIPKDKPQPTPWASPTPHPTPEPVTAPAPVVDRAVISNLFPPPEEVKGNQLNFVDGVSKSYDIRVRVLDSSLKYKIATDNLPAGAELRATEEKGVYRLTWTPKIDFTEDELMRQAFFSIKLVDVVAENPELNAELQRLVLERRMVLTVVRSRKVPTIKSISISGGSDSGVTIQQGQKAAFKVVVEDRSSLMKPALAFMGVRPTREQKNVLENALEFVTLDPVPAERGNGVYEFSGTIQNTDRIQFPAGMSELKGVFTVKAVNDGSNMSSAAKNIEFKVISSGGNR